MSRVTGTQFNYYMVCHRKLWLFSRGITMEWESDMVLEGKLIHEESFPRRSERFQEIEIEGIKIDYYDPNEKIIHEIKKSDKFEEAHKWQVRYYISILEAQGIQGVSGLLEYPKLRQTEKVSLNDEDRRMISGFLTDIERIVNNETCPPKKKVTACKNCSYFDFCWSGEEEDINADRP